MPLCTFFRRPRNLLASRRAVHVAASRRQTLEDRIQALHRVSRPTDHLAVTALQTPHAAAGADVAVVNPLPRQFLGVADIVDVVRVPSVDDGVALLEQRGDLGDHPVHGRGRDHQPHGARRLKLADHVGQRRRADRLIFDHHLLDGVLVEIANHDLVSAANQAAHHIGAHAAQSNHSELHFSTTLLFSFAADSRNPYLAN